MPTYEEGFSAMYVHARAIDITCMHLGFYNAQQILEYMVFCINGIYLYDFYTFFVLDNVKRKMCVCV